MLGAEETARKPLGVKVEREQAARLVSLVQPVVNGSDTRLMRLEPPPLAQPLPEQLSCGRRIRGELSESLLCMFGRDSQESDWLVDSKGFT